MSDARRPRPFRSGRTPPKPTVAYPPATDGDLLVRFLERHEVSCPACGYDLRGVRDARCPECAAELALTVASNKDGVVHVAATPPKLEAAARAAVRATRRTVAASRDAFAEHHTRSATLDAFAQIGLIVGITIHAAVAVWCVIAWRPATIALGVVMLLVVAVSAVLLRLSFEAAAWAASQRATIRCAYALGGWWWFAVWPVLALVSLF